MMKLLRVAVVIAAIALPALGAAQDHPKDEEHHGPHPEALAACKDKGEGDTCEFDGHHGHVVGTCRKARTGELFCMHPHHHDGGTGG